ncbi:NADP-dependent malic enzyme [Candidatus Deianiraea vastatrix]|uniref:NADP-dependent malic enzyme n=1 Tax=Candidatus Deianiraea vastatrix TaxID=2163644 RepID=A0A5B8XD38_9RICK|nr:NADP-dependent malic enzyme [Candidatus Deianiraea vastatrix]QED23242.1 NADP-dependent malic enzyme [Candidatus Deianiraea vastatrix]
MSGKNQQISKVTKEEALEFHRSGKPGKLEVSPIKQLATVRDLSLAYSPGVGFPCLEIEKDPDLAYEYTSKGNFVAVISNGTAVLGFGDIGALAGKPVMEGKSVLFKRFADIDSIDVEVETRDSDELINVVKNIGRTWGGINLEDIRGPECFYIEKKLQELLDIPVFHDDQHGTAIISLAAVINAAKVTGRKFSDMKMVVNGAGAAGISCYKMIRDYGLKPENCILCDQKGPIYKGRTDSMTELKEQFAVETSARTLTEALKGADLVLGLSVKGAFTQEMIKGMAPNPIVFAMANPEPEITPEEIFEVRPDAIIATGRSDYPNQVNNVMCFPFLFRGALDVRATQINQDMKMAAAEAIAKLAELAVPDEVLAAYPGRKLEFGRQYILPTPFDPRLIIEVASEVAKAAMKTGVARKKIDDIEKYKKALRSRLDPSVNAITLISESVKSNKKVCFAEGEEIESIKAAVMWRDGGHGKALLLGKRDRIDQVATENSINLSDIEIVNASEKKDDIEKYIDLLYSKLQRKGMLRSDCESLVKKDRDAFASLLLETKEVDSVICGVGRSYTNVISNVEKFSPIKKDSKLTGISILVHKNHMLFISDTANSELASSEELVQNAIQTAQFVTKMGIKPRVAFMSYSNFGSNVRKESERVANAVKILDKMKVDFEYEGEMLPSTALTKNGKDAYPFSRLTESANILIMPGLHSAAISSSLAESLGNCILIGPILSGFENSIQIVSPYAKARDIFNMALISGL